MEAPMKKRALNPSERRMTVRDSFKYYNSLLVAGIYQSSSQEERGGPSQPSFYFAALRHCIETHPMLAIVVKDDYYIHVENIDLQNHVNMLTHISDLSAATEETRIASILEYIHNDPEISIFRRPQGVPPWRLDILPLDASSNRVFISFTYSHCIADGTSGTNFHSTFLAALNQNKSTINAHLTIKESEVFILPHLPVSLSYLLGPALGHYLPRFISRWLGLKASVSGSDDNTWVGRNVFDDRLSPDEPVQTAVEVLTVDGKILSEVLLACRRHQAKLTALLNELLTLCIGRRLGRYYADFASRRNFVSCTPINLRKASGLPADSIGNLAGGTYSFHPIIPGSELKVNEEVWTNARINGVDIAEAASDLQNQPTGLLSWISNMKSWMGDQLGHARDSSWELSNLMSFKGEIIEGAVTVEKMFFCQPANVVGQPIQLNVISVKGGELVICVSWQVGAIGLDKTDTASVEDNERRFITEVLQDLKTLLDLAVES